MPKSGLQLSITMLRILVLLRAEKDALWNYAIAKKLTLSQDTTIRQLKRLELDGWVISKWESEAERIDRAPTGWAPKRKFYRLTPRGDEQTQKSLDDLRIS
jgi:DNA-binding PadR family transcriptional regulator